jgi:RNA polymerase sigma-70 factor (ECF subfamily)
VRTHREDDVAFADWYGALWPQVLRAVTVTVGDPDLAEEATAEAFAKAFARWPRPLRLSSPAGWLHAVAVNEVRSRWRRAKIERRALQRIGAQPPAQPPSPEPADEGLWQAVAALPTRARHILALRYLLDLPEAEIATTLGIARGTVASTLSKSRKQLAAVLARPTPESSRPDSPDEARGETRR